MSVVPAKRSQVTLAVGTGLPPPDRAALTRLLLEKGLEVSCRQDEGRTDPAGSDPVSLAAAIARESSPPQTAPVATWKPWFPVIDYSRCTNCMQCLSFCLFDVYGVSAEQKIQVQNQSNCKTECP